jgi:predicted TIM-barrel fold metal-dependent hydrolase
MRTFAAILLSVLPLSAKTPPPIIDVHVHAASASSNGPAPTAACTGTDYPAHDPAKSWVETWDLKNPPCAKPVWGPSTDAEVMTQTLEILKRRNIIAVASGPPDRVQRWKAAGGERIIPALVFYKTTLSEMTPEDLRKSFAEKRYLVFGEVALQYDGMSPSEPEFDPYLGVAEEMDVPMGIHIGTGPPGAPYLPGMGNYRARLHSALVLEEALIKHPKLRVYVMHAGWPMLDDMLAIMWAHPRVYVDTGAISWALPRKEFHRYLQRIVEAGFGKRVMFGSDQMNFPGTIEVAIDAIESADFLTAAQKRDIFYNNAARFLRLSEEQMAKHRGQ